VDPSASGVIVRSNFAEFNSCPYLQRRTNAIVSEASKPTTDSGCRFRRGAWEVGEKMDTGMLAPTSRDDKEGHRVIGHPGVAIGLIFVCGRVRRDFGRYPCIARQTSVVDASAGGGSRIAFLRYGS